MNNKNIASILEEIGNMLDIQGENFFRVNAYRKAISAILNLSFELKNLVKKNPGEIKKIPEIGDAMKDKIVELVNTGKCKEYENMKKTFPNGLLELLNLRSMGPKKVRLLHLQLGITNLKQLKHALQEKVIRELPGMGEKTEQEIIKAIKEYEKFSIDRFLINDALEEAEKYINYLKQFKEIKQIQFAGSLRRAKETIGDIDILITIKNSEGNSKKIMDYFTSYEEILENLSKGETKASVILQSGIRVDLRVIDENSFGAALHYFTGSKDHNIKIRDLAKKKGLKVNEYGVFKNEKFIVGKDEKEIFNSVGLPYIIPEIRRNDGEIEYGLKNKKFPKFIELKDIKGDLHSHSVYSDGENTIEEMANSFIKKDYEYFSITDHSSTVGATNGLNNQKIKKQWKEVEKLNKKLKGKIKILKGCEVDILKNGDLDFSNEILKELDIVIISPHIYGQLPEEEQTKRFIKAIENPYSRILGHPTGRMINKRAEMELDIEKIIKACVVNNVILEINSNPNRLDLSEKYIKIAKNMGAKFVINTDAHNPKHLEFMKFGVGMARRGWLTKKDIINTMDLKKFDSFLK